MKNAILISGAIAAVLTMQVISYRVGVADGEARERHGKCLTQMMHEMAAMTTWLAKIQAK